jgi:hypothetical protein
VASSLSLSGMKLIRKWERFSEASLIWHSSQKRWGRWVISQNKVKGW